MQNDNTQSTSTSCIYANWPAPENIHALSTTRLGGNSNGVYSSLNLGTHVEDGIANVLTNRKKLMAIAKLPSEPIWLNQIHGNHVVTLTNSTSVNPKADAAITIKANIVCAILSADCLPILICNRQGTHVAAIHAGWRSLHADIIRNTVEKLALSTNDLIVWFAPAISKTVYEVSDDVWHAFCNKDNAMQQAFTKKNNGKWLADLTCIATLKLNACGVKNIYNSNYCTYSNAKLFYSYRRDGITGRMATLIWMD